jgi:hypothetical protein
MTSFVTADYNEAGYQIDKYKERSLSALPYPVYSKGSIVHVPGKGLFISNGTNWIQDGGSQGTIKIRRPKKPLITSLAPTISVSVAGAGTTVPSGVLIPPTRRDASFMEVDNEPNYQIIGAAQGKVLLDAGSFARPALLTNGGAQAARYGLKYRTQWYGSICDIKFRALSTSLRYRIWINGDLVTEDFQVITVVIANQYRIIIDFTATGFDTRIIEIELSETDFAGFTIEPTGSLQNPRIPRLRLGSISNSILGGANGITREETWPEVAAGYVDADRISLDIGGSGFIAFPTYASRIQDVIDNPCDVLFWGDPYNDVVGHTNSEILTAIDAFWQLLRPVVGNIKHVFLGPWSPSQTISAQFVELEALCKAYCLAQNIPYCSYFDLWNTVAAVTPWAPLTVYTVNALVSNAGTSWTCTTAHTSTSTFDATKWLAKYTITGTGKSGSTVGDGNADTFIAADAIHPLLPANKFIGQRKAAWLYNSFSAA